ncbi:hypothetical protein, partial [Chromobacterium piscinae]|uniref:hypothetical protein n=1 Tax=Chromobacterium piscinae TaxID=686831 RepID=UPI003D15EB05
MREPNQQQQQPFDGEDESNLNGKLKKRLWIAGGLVAVALAAIPLMDALTKPKVEMSSDAQSPSSGKIIKPASSADAGAISIQIKPASAPAAQSSAPAAEAANHAPAAPAETIPATPDLSKTPAVANPQPGQGGTGGQLGRLPSSAGPVLQHEQCAKTGAGPAKTRHRRPHRHPRAAGTVQKPRRGGRSDEETARTRLFAAARRQRTVSRHGTRSQPKTKAPANARGFLIARPYSHSKPRHARP